MTTPRVTLAAPVSRVRTSLDHRDVLAFLVPALLPIELVGGGRLFFSEVILLAVLPAFLWRSAVRFDPLARRIFFLGLLWLWAQVFSDLLNGSAFADYSRGWLRIVFTLTNFAALYLLIEFRARRLQLLGAGIACGLLLAYVMHPSAYSEGDPWKFGYGVAVTFAAVLVATLGPVTRRALGPASVLAAAGAVNLQQGFRSMAGVCFVTAIYLVLHHRATRRREDSRPLRPGGVIALVVAGVLATAGVMHVYVSSAKAGWLGAQQQQKLAVEETGGLGVLIDGRPEVLTSIRAIADAPIFGHGSYAHDSSYTERLIADLRSRGSKRYVSTKSDVIPTHSHVMGAWVESGVLGALFWVWILVLTSGTLIRLFVRRNKLAPLISFFALLLTWDVFFSPFGAERRLIVPYVFVLLLSVLRIESEGVGEAEQS